MNADADPNRIVSFGGQCMPARIAANMLGIGRVAEAMQIRGMVP